METFRLAHFFTAGFTMIILSVLSTTFHTSLFGLTRSIVLPILYKFPILPRILKPFSAHFVRGSFSLVLLAKHWTLICRASILGFTTASSWEFAEGLFDILVAEVGPVRVPGDVYDLTIFFSQHS